MAYTFKHGDRPLDGYTVQRAVGRGGFGEVYYAISDGGREVAVKYLRDNPQVELRGVSHCINLKSPHLVSIFDVKKTNEDDYCIIMEYCSGPSLRDLLIAEPNGFAPEKAAFFLREIAKGLSYLHDRGIVHRDLKPGNIFYDDGYVKIGDYGLSKIITISRHSAQTASVGTVHYMAPEIGSGNYSRGVDIYALGVMLYEMLMGTVPFEGSTMAEVLMKHLTSQPEVDKLPHPFGKVIRKALEKDPKDRYQTVDEMVEELLGVEEIEKSLAGFSPKSLQSAVKHGGAGLASPMPSPNPVPRPPQGNLPPFAIPVGSGRPLTGKAKRRLDRIARKVERKRAKLAGTKPNLAPPTTPTPVYDPQAPSPAEEVDKHIRRRRIALTVFMAVVLSVAFGVVCGNTAGKYGEEIGGTAGMLVPLLVGAIALGRKATRWFAIDPGPTWATALVRAGCALPLLALACAPILDSPEHRDGLSVWIAMVLVAMFAKWNSTIETCVSGEISFWRAVWTGFGGLIAYCAMSAFLSSGPDDIYMWVTFGAAGITSLIVQASAWWLVPPRGYRSGAPTSRDVDQGRPSHGIACCDERFGAFEAETVLVTDRWAHPNQDGVRGQVSHGVLDDVPPAKLRWGITRAFWGFVALAASFGTIATFVLSLVGTGSADPYHDATGTILGCIGLFSFTIFALRKTTSVKRDGFWRETLRPFLIAVFMFGIGGTITAISREWGPHPKACCGGCVDDTGAAFLIAGLVVSSLMLLFLTFFTGRRPKHPKSFLTGSAPGAAPVQPRRDQDFGVERIVAVGNANDVDPLASAE